MRNLRIGLMGLCFLFLVACSGGKSPSKVAKKFMDAINRHEYDEARKLATEDTGKLIDLMESLSKLSNAKQANLTADIQIKDEKIEGNTAYVSFIQDSTDEPQKIKLVKMDDEWKVDVSKADIATKNAEKNEGEEGFYEEDNYTDAPADTVADTTGL